MKEENQEKSHQHPSHLYEVDLVLSNFVQKNKLFKIHLKPVADRRSSI